MIYKRCRKVPNYSVITIACTAAALLMLQGCTDLTEFEHTLQAGIHIMNTPDISVVHTIENISGARSLCSLTDCFIVATIKSYFAPPHYTGTVTIDGDIHYICAESDGSHAYVLSYLGDNISRVVAYNCSNCFIESQIDLQGYPLDLEISPGGTLLALTAE